VRKQLWQDPVVAPVEEDLAAVLAAADLEEVTEVALAAALAAADSAVATEVAIIIARIMAIIVVHASLDLVPVITDTVVADAWAVF
jgi:hypothetical protein